ncbi:hypothetical protein PJL18_02309 [Paenarthrobacter nicotinovorans]|nr:hypothetical protein [Paenarthrobacter nicotinovorans]
MEQRNGHGKNAKEGRGFAVGRDEEVSEDAVCHHPGDQRGDEDTEPGPARQHVDQGRDQQSEDHTADDSNGTGVQPRSPAQEGCQQFPQPQEQQLGRVVRLPGAVGAAAFTVELVRDPGRVDVFREPRVIPGPLVHDPQGAQQTMPLALVPHPHRFRNEQPDHHEGGRNQPRDQGRAVDWSQRQGTGTEGPRKVSSQAAERTGLGALASAHRGRSERSLRFPATFTELRGAPGSLISHCLLLPR